MRRCAFVVLVVTQLLGFDAAAMAQGSPPATPSPAATPPISEDERPLLPAEAEALRTEMKETLHDAERAQSATQDEVSRILGLMEDFLGFLAVVLAIAGALSFVGFLESRKVRNEVKEDLSEVRDEARSVVRKAQEARQRAEQVEKRLTTAVKRAEQDAQRIAISLNKSWSRIDAALRKLPSLDVAAESEGLESEAPDLPIKALSNFEDADAVLVLCDQFEMTDEREKMGTHFLNLARFWVLKKEYPRALARAERAVELIAPNTRERADAHRYVAWSLANWADLLPSGSPHRGDALQQALKELDKVKVELDRIKLEQGDDSRYHYLYVLAWTLETQGEYERAAAVYKEAREEDRNVVAVRKGRKEDWRITYNRACSLVMVGRLEEALDEVELFLKTWPEDWPRVMNDPDLKPLRSDSWKERFDPLVEDAKSRIEGAS